MIQKHLKTFPAVALLGARQVGKSTLARHLIESVGNTVYHDLENPRDLARLQDPMTFLESNRNALVCIDEVQRMPEIFRAFRSYLDGNRGPGRLLILGSASPDLIKQSSETLAGRISFIEIGPFTIREVEDWKRLWLQGGYPESYRLNEDLSYDWRTNYVRTFLERDLPQLGITIPAATLRRFWTMLAHMNGSILNQSTLASSMGVSVPTIRKYLDILEGALVIRRLPSFAANTKKRLVKSPKIYIRDTGLIHNLLGVESFNDLLGHPCLGGSYEALAISSLLEAFPRHTASFYRSSGGSEIDLVLEKGRERIAYEMKASSAPDVGRGLYEAMKVVNPDRTYIVAPVEGSYPLKDGIIVGDLRTICDSR